MSQIITNENDAMDILKRKCAYTVDPVLDEANELVPILQESQRATVWAAATAYYIGQEIVPTLANRTGNRFICVQAGTSGGTEPSWSSGAQPPFVGREWRFNDGTVIWQENGIEYANLWDIRRAAYLCWQLKIDKVSCQYDFKSGDSTDYMSKRIEALERIRDRYAPVHVL